jgi:hypothetical protein
MCHMRFGSAFNTTGRFPPSVIRTPGARRGSRRLTNDAARGLCRADALGAPLAEPNHTRTTLGATALRQPAVLELSSQSMSS